MWDDSDIKPEFQENQQAIISKFLSEKPVDKNFIAAGLAIIWYEAKGIKIKESEASFHHICMNNPSDIKRILKGNPWIFRIA